MDYRKTFKTLMTTLAVLLVLLQYKLLPYVAILRYKNNTYRHPAVFLTLCFGLFFVLISLYVLSLSVLRKPSRNARLLCFFSFLGVFCYQLIMFVFLAYLQYKLMPVMLNSFALDFLGLGLVRLSTVTGSLHANHR